MTSQPSLMFTCVTISVVFSSLQVTEPYISVTGKTEYAISDIQRLSKMPDELERLECLPARFNIPLWFERILNELLRPKAE